MTLQHILAIDLGTSSVKAALVADDGWIAATAVEPVATLYGEGGAAEQDAERIWSAVLAAATRVLSAGGAAARDVAAVTCDAQYFSVVPVGIDGRPLANLLLWHDTRGTRYSRALHRAHPHALARWLEINGMFPLPSGSDSLSHLLYVREERPEVYARTAAFLEPADYVVARLTGRCTANPCTAFAQLLTDNRDLSDVRYDDELLDTAGVDRAVLPELVECGATVGTLLPEVADALGLSPATPVLSGMNDTQAVSIGTGVFRAGRSGINVGTTCQVLGFADELRADLDNNLFAMPAPIPDRYTLMAENGLGARLVDHFLHNIVFADDALAHHATADPYAGMEAALAAAPAGSGGVLFLPWLNGSQTPRASASMRGGFLNMSLATTREHLLRAVVEGITYSLAWQLPAAERLCGTAFTELRFAGGGARSAQWAQTIADVADRPVVQMADPLFLNNRATAFHAFVRLGRVGLDEVDGFCPAGARFEPRSENRDLYDQLSAQFQVAYAQTRPIFEALNSRRARGAAKESTPP